MEVDAAGNIYITDNISELLQVFSPGGETATDFSFDGANYSFSVLSPSAGLPGDYNEDNVVDAADYTVWRDNLGADTIPNRAAGSSGPVGTDDYAYWKAHFGESLSGSGGLAGGAVPEPTTGLLMFLRDRWPRDDPSPQPGLTYEAIVFCRRGGFQFQLGDFIKCVLFSTGRVS